MSFGKINDFIEIVSITSAKDTEGFAIPGDNVLANVRAYFEQKNNTEKWRNNAAFAEATVLFRFRAIPGLIVDATMVIIHNGKRYNIISSEDVKGRGMYIEVFGKSQSPSMGVIGNG